MPATEAPAEGPKDTNGKSIIPGTPLFDGCPLTWEHLMQSYESADDARKLMNAAVFGNAKEMGNFAKYSTEFAKRWADKVVPEKKGGLQGLVESMTPAAMVAGGGAGVVMAEIGKRVERLVKGGEMEIYAEATPSRLLERLVHTLGKKFDVRDEDTEDKNTGVLGIYAVDNHETPLLRVLLQYTRVEDELFDHKKAFDAGKSWKPPMKTTTKVLVSSADEDETKRRATSLLSEAMDIFIAATDGKSAQTILAEGAEALSAGMDAKALSDMTQKVYQAIEDVAKEVEGERKETEEIIEKKNETYRTNLKASRACEFCDVLWSESDEKILKCPNCGAASKSVYPKNEADERWAAAGF